MTLWFVLALMTVAAIFAVLWPLSRQAPARAGSDVEVYRDQLDEIERDLAKGQPVYAHILTTSNHRPYTYPANRIDIPSGTGRDGAVKYTDYAIGQLLSAKQHDEMFFQRRPDFRIRSRLELAHVAALYLRAQCGTVRNDLDELVTRDPFVH